MTDLQKTVLKAIKEHNKNREMEELNKGIKFVEFGKYFGKDFDKPYGDTYHCEYNEDYSLTRRIEDAYLRLSVRCEFKPEDKEGMNCAEYEVMLISNGDIDVFFNGLEWN